MRRRFEELTVEEAIRVNDKLIAMMESSPVVINDHSGREIKLTGLVEFTDPKMGLACCCDYWLYCLNRCYGRNNGELHLSTTSIAGNMYGAYPDSKQIKKYNNEHLSKIKCIHRPDGTKVYPAE